MQITINGQTRTVRESLSMAELLVELELDPRRLAVERNRLLLRRSQFDATVLQAGDVLEIVTLVGGG